MLDPMSTYVGFDVLADFESTLAAYDHPNYPEFLRVAREADAIETEDGTILLAPKHGESMVQISNEEFDAFVDLLQGD